MPSEIQLATEVKSTLLKEIFGKIPKVLKTVQHFQSQIDPQSAAKNDKGNLFLDPEAFPKIIACKQVLPLFFLTIFTHFSSSF
jgi:hypothetical protein